MIVGLPIPSQQSVIAKAERVVSLYWAPMRSMPWLVVCTCLMIFGGLATQPAAAQNVDEVPAWEVMRIFMPESLDNVVPRDYLTFPLSELEKLLAEDARRRQLSAGQAAGIQRATYVARWSDQLLFSGASLWQTIRPTNANPLTIGRTSLAIDDPVGLASDMTPLTRHLRYLDDNRLQISGGEGQSDYWFGFRAKARRRDSGQQSLELVLPRALLATMLISVPQHSTLTSNLPCLRVDDPSQFLPSDWPTSAVPTAIPGEQWYLLLMSGRDACTLNFSPTRNANQYPYRMSVASAQCEINAQPAGMNVTSRFQLSKAPTSGLLRVALEDPLHVRSIQINGTESTNWHSIIDEARLGTAPAVATRTIEIPCDGVGTGPLVLTINCVGRMSLPFDTTLPRVEIVDAFVLDGRCTLSSQERVQIEDVQTAGQRLTTSSTNNGNSNWQWQWTGKTPTASARIKATTNQWSVRALARFSLQKDVVVATAHVNIRSSNVQGNQVALELAQGWFVDSVQIENAPLGVSVDVRDGDDRASLLSVHWEERRSDLDVRLIINAHYHQRTDVDVLQLPPTRIVSLAGSDQQDTYVIEQSGRFQLNLDPELLRMRVTEDELPPWQRATLGRVTDAWIFRSGRSELPAIRLERIRAMFESRLHTTIQANEKEATITYRVACDPISGSINQLKLLLPIPTDAVAPTWTLVPRFDGSVPKGLQVSSRATSSSKGETSFTIDLSQDTSEEFQIEAELRLATQSANPAAPGKTSGVVNATESPNDSPADSSQTRLTVPLPSIPQSVSQDTVVVLPSGYQLPAEVDSLEILPNGLCCSDGQLVDSTTAVSVDGTAMSTSGRVVAARYDPNTVSHLHLVRSESHTDGAWVHEQLHQHWQHPGGRTTHHSTWLLTLAEPRWVEIALPQRWNHEVLLIDGRDARAETKPTLRVRLPRGDRVRLELKCSSQQQSGWSPWLSFETPDLGLPVHQSRELVWFAGHTYAGQGLPSHQSFDLTHRFQVELSPWSWWKWLSPAPVPRDENHRIDVQLAKSTLSLDADPEKAAQTLAARPGYSAIAMQLPTESKIRDESFWWPLRLEPMTARGLSQRVWCVDASRVACVALAICLIVTGCTLTLCGTSAERWWLTWITVGALLILVPNWALMPVQSAALGLVAATLLRLSQFLVHISKPAAKRGGDSVHSNLKALWPRWKTTTMDILGTTSPATGLPATSSLPSGSPSSGSPSSGSPSSGSPSSGSPSTSTTTSVTPSVILLALVIWPAATAVSAWAQPFSKNATRDREEIFGILIPLDSDNKVAGDLVYVPTRLYSLLNNSSQPDYKSGSVSITAAFYSLPVLNDPISLTSSVGEITAELNVQANRAEAELKLPFRRDELQLQRAYVDSSSLSIGERLRQDAEQLIWRAGDTERHVLRLVFRPKTITMKEGRGSLSVSIPPIPTAKLDVMGDDLRDVVVEAIGGTQLDSPRSLIARLGPINKLSINWPLLLGRSSTVQVQSDTWLHTRGEQVMALCQLKVRGAAGLPSALHVVGDINWAPVGPDWEDYRMLSTEGVTASGRPVYTVERSGENASEVITLRVLLLPKTDVAPTSLPIPFLAFQEVAAQQRTLAISHSESALWKANGTEAFQPLLASQSVAIWEKARLAEQPTFFKIPNGSLSTTLSRVPSSAAPTVSELTEISLQSPEVKIKYSARWSQPLIGKSTIRFRIPKGLRVDGAFVDSSPARFVQHEIDSEESASNPTSQSSELNVHVDGNLGGLHSLHLQLSMPAVLNKPQKLPHVLLQDIKIESSLLQIYRGAELQSELHTVGDAPLTLERFDLKPSPLLLNLHSLIGQVDLGDRYRETTELPLEVRLARAPTSRRARAVLRLLRGDQGWRAQLDALVDVAQGETDHIFLDLPRSLENPVDVNVPMMLWPSAESNRGILCVLPPASSDSMTHISLTFRLPTAGASQSITIPDIRLLGLSIDRPVLALPKSIAGQDVRWSQVGRALPSQWLQTESLQDLGLDDFTLHEAGGNQLQAVWHTSDGEEQGARILLTRVGVQQDAQSQAVQGHIGYWIEPRNQAYLNVTLPQNCQLIGALAGNSPVPWNQTADHQLRILMQPSYLPVRIHLFVKWFDLNHISSSELQLPLPQLSARNGGPILVGSRTSSELSWQIESSSRLSPQEMQQLLAQSLADTLILSSPTAADRDGDELRAWLPNWNPDSLGLADSISVTVPASSAIRKAGGNAEEESRTTLGEFWADYLSHRSITDATTLVSDLDRSESRLTNYVWSRLPSSSSTTQLTMQLSTQAGQRHSSQWVIALAWVVIMAFVGMIGRRWIEAGLALASAHVWPIWLGLTVALALFLPVVWPSLILLLCTLLVVARRYRELRRDHQFTFRPRAVR